MAGKDTFYRFKARSFRRRSLLYKVMLEIGNQLQFDQTAIDDNYLI